MKVRVMTGTDRKGRMATRVVMAREALMETGVDVWTWQGGRRSGRGWGSGGRNRRRRGRGWEEGGGGAGRGGGSGDVGGKRVVVQRLVVGGGRNLMARTVRGAKGTRVGVDSSNEEKDKNGRPREVIGRGQ